MTFPRRPKTYLPPFLAHPLAMPGVNIDKKTRVSHACSAVYMSYSKNVKISKPLIKIVKMFSYLKPVNRTAID